MESRSEIVQKLLYVAEHKEQCFDFQTQVWLEKYEKCKHERINFSEAAFLIISAAKIYGHKVDYLEQMLLEFNRRSAADFKATAKDAKNAGAGDDAAANGKSDEARSKEKAAEKEKEKLQKRQKRLLKLTNKIEFNPKQFTIAAQSQISLNIHEQRTDMDEDEYEQLRMKNVFPRINILQSNLQNNSSFYDNLGIIEKNCDNLDSLRDYRIFMDTIDEPMDLGMLNGDASNGNPNNNVLKNRGHEKHFNAYLSAEHIKEKYGVEMPDNSDYLNMLKYGEEIERLNLRKLTIEQLGQLKVGTYLNNILHGNKQDCAIPEADSGMGESLCDSAIEQSTAAESSLNSTAKSTDQSIGEPTIDQSIGEPTVGQSMSEPSTSLDCSAITDMPELMDTTHTDESTTLEVSQLNESIDERFGEHRHSLDDGLGSSLINSPVQIADLDAFERNMLNPVVEVQDIFYPMNKFMEMPNDFTVDLKDPMNDMLDPKEAKIVVPVMEFNIFQIPEKLLRKPKLFQLTEDFDLWIAARKRKAGCADDMGPKGKMFKLSTGAMVRADPDSDDEELLGFDADMVMRLQKYQAIVPSPAPIQNRSFSSDSGILDKSGMTVEGEAQLNPDGQNEQSMDMGDGTVVGTEQTALDISGEHQTGNSTEICNDQFDSGFGELLNLTENETLNATTHETDPSPTGTIELIPPALVSSLNDEDVPDICNESQTRMGKYSLM